MKHGSEKGMKPEMHKGMMHGGMMDDDDADMSMMEESKRPPKGMKVSHRDMRAARRFAMMMKKGK